MSTISIQQEHCLTTLELRQKIEMMMNEVKQEIDFNLQWESETELVFRRKGASGRIEIGDGKFEINVNLGLMFRALKGQVEKKILSAIEQHLK